MRPLVIVIIEPLVQVFLKLLNRGIKLFPESFTEELIEHGSIEAFHEAVGPGPCHFGSAMLNIVQLQEYLIGMNHRSPAVRTTIIREDVFHFEVLRFVEGQHPVIEDIHGGLRELGGVKLSKGKRTIGVDDSLEPDAADSLDPADVEGIL